MPVYGPDLPVKRRPLVLNRFHPHQIFGKTVHADSIPVELDVGIGTGRVEIDLSKIDLSSAEISEGVGKIEITLPESGDYPLEIRQAVGSMIIIVPEGSDVQIEVSKALSSLSLPPGFERNDEYIYSPGFDREGEFIDLRVNQAIGNIVIESAP